jgi:hypothetical protein
VKLRNSDKAYIILCGFLFLSSFFFELNLRGLALFRFTEKIRRRSFFSRFSSSGCVELCEGQGTLWTSKAQKLHMHRFVKLSTLSQI